MKTFIPYEGGAGPSNELIENNNQALYEAARAAGLKVKRARNSSAYYDVPADAPKIVKLGEVEVGFDRWGYCADGHEIDQVSFEQALAFLKSI